MFRIKHTESSRKLTHAGSRVDNAGGGEKRPYKRIRIEGKRQMLKEDGNVGTLPRRTCEDSEARQRDDQSEEYTTSATKKRPAKVKPDGITSCNYCL
jgi:hypothetical protein